MPVYTPLEANLDFSSFRSSRYRVQRPSGFAVELFAKHLTLISVGSIEVRPLLTELMGKPYRTLDLDVFLSS